MICKLARVERVVWVRCDEKIRRNEKMYLAEPLIGVVVLSYLYGDLEAFSLASTASELM